MSMLWRDDYVLGVMRDENDEYEVACYGCSFTMKLPRERDLQRCVRCPWCGIEWAFREAADGRRRRHVAERYEQAS